MTQRHLDRLSAVDATFLHQEDETSHMHIGGVVILEGTPPTYEEFCAHLASHLDAVPRYRQKLVTSRYARPLWIDDPTFNIEYHVRHTALPSPGDDDRLFKLTARIFSQRLDRSKPLWEFWLVEGLRLERFALISKTHHSLVDGVSGAELMTVLFDLSSEYEPAGPSTWRPHPVPSTTERVAADVRDLGGAISNLVSRAVSLGTSGPSGVLERAREAAEGLGEVALAIANPAPPTPLNVPIGPHRRFTTVRGRLDDYKLIKNTFGGTVNDVVLTVVSGALNRFLRGRGVRTDGLVLRALVPVSTRVGADRTALGNRLTVMLARLPVHITDPVTRLAAVREEMDALKQSKQPIGADIIAGVQAFAPPTLLAQSSRLAMSSRMYNLLVTNVPGPQFRVYALGRRLLEVIPVPFLAPDHAVAVAIMSYDGGINFGILGDYDELSDIDVLRDAVAEELDRMMVLARRHSGIDRSVANGKGGNGLVTAADGHAERKSKSTNKSAARRKTTPRNRG